MKFQFSVNVNDQDYLDYNTFWTIRSPYGRKQIKIFRITITVIFAIFILISLFSGGFSIESFLGLIPIFIVLCLFQILLTRFFVWSLKGQIKALKESGKMGYSPESIIQFYEDKFVEITSENKTEQKYIAIERISIVDNKMIYIHVNNVMSYMLPMSCFESKEQYEEFYEFIKTRCTSIDVY